MPTIEAEWSAIVLAIVVEVIADCIRCHPWRFLLYITDYIGFFGESQLIFKRPFIKY